MSNKPCRNDPCPCGSGLKYKYCCISKDLKERKISIKNCNCTNCGATYTANINLTKDPLNVIASENIPIMNFCKDNGLYFFSICLTVGELNEIRNKLQKNILKIDHILSIYKKHFNKKFMFGLLDSANEELEIYKKRNVIIKDALEAHFNGKYTLSVPVFFTQLEGILRDYGNIPDNDNVKPTIPVDKWNERMAFFVKDQAEYFNSFITNLFKGSGDSSEFNRNPILHGTNINYNTEKNSMVLFLTILEIRNFIWMENKLKSIFQLKEST